MNEPTIRLETRPEITDFVERVRARLADLSDEDREELVGGLEADIAELVADGGTVAELGDPRAYADELRAAAGLENHRGSSEVAGAPRRPLGERIAAALDDVRRDLGELTRGPRLQGAAAFLLSLRPVWWVLRAWVAVQLVALVFWGGQAGAVPMLGGPLVGSILWLVAVVVSVQIGRGVLWPGSGPDRPVATRVVLVGLNAFAIVMLPLVAEQLPSDGVWDQAGYVENYIEPTEGLVLDGDLVRNVFPYDVEGRPLEGVQLFDQDGNPLSVAGWAGEEYDDTGSRVSVVYPWFNGEKQLFNVFPLPRRSQSTFREGSELQPDAWVSNNPPVLPNAPLAVVPPATLPGQEPADEPAAGPEAPDSGPGAGRERDSEKAQVR
ncbi:MAG: HAAS signaling domain-containing protein [Actinomycetota bacterium]